MYSLTRVQLSFYLRRFLIIAISLMLSACATQDRFERIPIPAGYSKLSGAEIYRVLINTCYGYRIDTCGEYHSDGTLVKRRYKEPNEHAKWWIEDDRLCDSHGLATCDYVYKNGRKLLKVGRPGETMRISLDAAEKSEFSRISAPATQSSAINSPSNSSGNNGSTNQSAADIQAKLPAYCRPLHANMEKESAFQIARKTDGSICEGSITSYYAYDAIVKFYESCPEANKLDNGEGLQESKQKRSAFLGRTEICQYGKLRHGDHYRQYNWP